MSGKRKLEKFAAIKTFSNVFENNVPKAGIRFQNYYMKGKWKTDYFKNDHPLVLELGCGKGEYSVGMGAKFPDKNFIGLDIKGNRIWYGATEATAKNLNNVVFLRTRIDFIESFFAPNEVDEIWITFPDPQPQKNRARKRLTAPLFLNRYLKILKPNGIIHLKTDSAFLYQYTNEVIEENKYQLLESIPDLYASKINEFDAATKEILAIQTYYEKLFMSRGHKITYTKFIIH